MGTLAQAKDPVRIGLVSSKSGVFAQQGEEVIRAIQFAIDEANASGGVDGRKVEVQFPDDEGTPDAGRRNAEKLARDGYNLLIGPIPSSIALAIAPNLDRWDAAFFSVASKSDKITGDSRAATLGLPMALAIIGGLPERFKPFTDLYREAARQSGHDQAQLPLSINSHGFIADDSQQAADDYFPSYQMMVNKIGRERGWPPVSRQQFQSARTLRGSDFVGNPDDIIAKILFQHQLFGHQRLLLQLGIGTIAHDKMMRAIELLGTKIAPVVREEIGRRTQLAN